jgi:uncharacterized protein (TIGR00251 family)
VPSDTLTLTPEGDGVLLALRVSAGASKTRILGIHAGALKLSVQAPPEKGKANAAVARLVAETFGVPPSAVAIVRGETSPDKTVRLPLSPDEARARWAAGRA